MKLRIHGAGQVSQPGRPDVSGGNRPSSGPGAKRIGPQHPQPSRRIDWYYHRIELEQLQTEERSPERIERLREEAKERESRFVRTLREMPSDELASTALVPPSTMTVEEVRAALAPDTAILGVLLHRRQSSRHSHHQREFAAGAGDLAVARQRFAATVQFQLSNFNSEQNMLERLKSSF